MEFVNNKVSQLCFRHHELKEDLNIRWESEKLIFLVFVMIILLTFKSIEAIEKTVEQI